jgi:hypothetical protein
MKRRKMVKAVCVPLAAVLGTSLVIEADNPHVEQRQHEEEPRMSYESAYTTTSAVVLKFPWVGLGLESIPGSLPPEKISRPMAGRSQMSFLVTEAKRGSKAECRIPLIFEDAEVAVSVSAGLAVGPFPTHRKAENQRRPRRSAAATRCG